MYICSTCLQRLMVRVIYYSRFNVYYFWFGFYCFCCGCSPYVKARMWEDSCPILSPLLSHPRSLLSLTLLVSPRLSPLLSQWQQASVQQYFGSGCGVLLITAKPYIRVPYIMIPCITICNTVSKEILHACVDQWRHTCTYYMRVWIDGDMPSFTICMCGSMGTNPLSLSL